MNDRIKVRVTSRLCLLGIAAGMVTILGTTTASATPPAGNTRTTLVQGTAPQGVDITKEGPTDVVVTDSVLTPGGTTGWHKHPGIEVVTVKSGADTFLLADDRDCRPVTVAAGGVLIVPAGKVHLARNDGKVAAEAVVTSFITSGLPIRADANKPEGCPS